MEHGEKKAGAGGGGPQRPYHCSYSRRADRTDHRRHARGYEAAGPKVEGVMQVCVHKASYNVISRGHTARARWSQVQLDLHAVV
eukprot:scaffold18750_cov113-Isochrysis_galbana.AAC.6